MKDEKQKNNDELFINKPISGVINFKNDDDYYINVTDLSVHPKSSESRISSYTMEKKHAQHPLDTVEPQPFDSMTEPEALDLFFQLSEHSFIEKLTHEEALSIYHGRSRLNWIDDLYYFDKLYDELKEIRRTHETRSAFFLKHFKLKDAIIIPKGKRSAVKVFLDIYRTTTPSKRRTDLLSTIVEALSEPK